MSEPAPLGTLRTAGSPPLEAVGQARELFVRYARKDGRTVAMVRAVDYGASCVVEAEVYAAGGSDVARPGPYTFGSAHEATAFVTQAVEALMVLGCDIAAE